MIFTSWGNFFFSPFFLSIHKQKGTWNSLSNTRFHLIKNYTYKNDSDKVRLNTSDYRPYGFCELIPVDE